MNSFDHFIKVATQRISELSTLSAEYAVQQSKKNLEYCNSLSRCYGDFYKENHEQKNSKQFFNSSANFLSTLSEKSAEHLTQSMTLATEKLKESEKLFDFTCPNMSSTQSEAPVSKAEPKNNKKESK